VTPDAAGLIYHGTLAKAYGVNGWLYRGLRQDVVMAIPGSYAPGFNLYHVVAACGAAGAAGVGRIFSDRAELREKHQQQAKVLTAAERSWGSADHRSRQPYVPVIVGNPGSYQDFVRPAYWKIMAFTCTDQASPQSPADSSAYRFNPCRLCMARLEFEGLVHAMDVLMVHCALESWPKWAG